MEPVELDRRRFVLLAAGMLAFGPRALGQEQEVKMMAADAHPSFEVATIKPSNPDDHSSGFQTMGHRLFYENERTEQLIGFAYSVHAKQIVGGPDWFSKDYYDIKGVPDIEGQPNEQQQREMLQKLLAERFNLKFHREKRDLSIFALTVAKGGPKLTVSKSDPNSLIDQAGDGNEGEQRWTLTNNSMADIARLLQYFLDRPVVDQTGLKGKFDLTLKWTTNDASSSAINSDPNAPPGIFTAVQEQLGLKLEATKGPAEVLVIDHVERPSAN